ncbi:MAG: HNH endonuclease, partial [Actinobacteria bacterium]|nr:HNH endonuclease [Actinomycetota bacterium]
SSSALDDRRPHAPNGPYQGRDRTSWSFDESWDEPSGSFIDPSSVDPSQRVHSSAMDEVARCYHMRSGWDRALMRAVVEVDRLRTYEQEGYPSTADWLTGFLGIGYMRACEFVEVAIGLESLPALKRAYERGQLSYDHLRALVAVANPDNEAQLAEDARGMSVADTFKMKNKLLAVPADSSVDARRGRTLQMRWDLEQRTLILFGLFPEEQGAIVERAIDAIARRMPEDPLFEFGTPMAVKRADAFLELAGAGATTRQGSSSNTQVVVHVDAQMLASGQGVAEIEGGPTLSLETVERLMCDCMQKLVVHDGEGRLMAESRSTSNIPRRIRRELARRDKTCRYPNCRRRKLVHAHHIVHRANNGPTELDNLVLFCPTHHHLVHEGGYRVVGSPPAIVIERPNRPPIKCGPPPRPRQVRDQFFWEYQLARGPEYRE